jgi:hypothetical protein
VELDELVAKTGRTAPVSQQSIDKLHQRLKADPTAWAEQRLVIRTAPAIVEPPTPKGDRVGLFVGVSKFEVGEAGVRFKLGAELMAKSMVERGGIDASKARLLVDEQATRGNIQTAITRWLPSVSRPGDTVFIFHAGHGGTIKNLDGTKQDGRDGYLTTYDNGWEKQVTSLADGENKCRSRFITDDALARWLQELPGRQIVLIVCSCHAGTLVDARVLGRFASREAARVKGISALNIAVIANAYPDESSYSARDKPVWIAYFLTEAMKKLPAPVTLHKAFDYYRQEHRRRFVNFDNDGFHQLIFADNILVPVILAP